MKNLIKLMSVLFALSLLAPLAFADTTTTPQAGTAKAKIVAPLVLAHATGDALNFGTLVSPAAQATVTIAPMSGVPTKTDDGVERIAADAYSADHFTVTNPEGVAYTINLPTSSVTISSGDNTMTVDTFTTDCASNCTATEFYVGGKLHIGMNQVAGQYQGTYNVSLTY